MNWPTAFWSITREPEFCQISDWWWNINENNSFHFRLFPGKLMTKFFQKSKKTLFWCHFGQFLPKFREKWIFLEKRALTGFKYSNYLPRSKKSENYNNRFLIKMLNCWWTDKQTDREPWFCRTLHGTAVQKIKFGTGCDSLWEGKK